MVLVEWAVVGWEAIIAINWPHAQGNERLEERPFGMDQRPVTSTFPAILLLSNIEKKRKMVPATISDFGKICTGNDLVALPTDSTADALPINGQIIGRSMLKMIRLWPLPSVRLCPYRYETIYLPQRACPSVLVVYPPGERAASSLDCSKWCWKPNMPQSNPLRV